MYTNPDTCEITNGSDQICTYQSTSRVSTTIRGTTSNTVPLSSGQQQIWLVDQLLSDTLVSHKCVVIHLPGPLDVSILERSFNEVLRRHEAWRTSFPLVDGQPIQKIHSILKFKLPTRDLRHLPEAEREPEAVRMMTEDAQQPFDLANGPLLRPTLIQLADMDHRLFLTLHHIICDAFSLYQIFLPELRALYDAFLVDDSSPLQELPFQYADFVLWQREALQGDILAEHLAYWRQHLAGMPQGLDLPSDRPRLPVPTTAGAIYCVSLPEKLTADLKELSRQEDVTLYMTLVAAFQTLLHRYTGQDDLVIGTVTSGRARAETEALLGLFENTHGAAHRSLRRSDLSCVAATSARGDAFGSGPSGCTL